MKEFEYFSALKISDWIRSHIDSLKYNKVKIGQIRSLLDFLIKNIDRLDVIEVYYDPKTKEFKETENAL